MKPEQFDRLVATFWKTGKPEEQAATFREYRKALAGVSDHAIDAAVDRAIREGEKMPVPFQLRKWATEAVPPTRAGEGMVVCVGRDNRHGKCGALFPMWTDCPECYPNGSRTPRPMVAFPQCSLKDEEQVKAERGYVPRYIAPWLRPA